MKEKAILLRKQGYSYTYIQTKIPVAKSTLSEWLTDIQFIPNTYTIQTIGKARVASGVYKNKQKILNLIKAKDFAKKDMQYFSKRDRYMVGLGVYIGEGSKTTNFSKISSSDSRIIYFMMTWFQVCFNVPKDNLQIRLHLYPDNNFSDCIEYWMRQTGLSRKQFLKPVIDQRTNKSLKKKNILPYGTAHLSVLSKGEKELGVFLHRRIMALINEIL